MLSLSSRQFLITSVTAYEPKRRGKNIRRTLMGQTIKSSILCRPAGKQQKYPRYLSIGLGEII